MQSQDTLTNGERALIERPGLLIVMPLMAFPFVVIMKRSTPDESGSPGSISLLVCER